MRSQIAVGITMLGVAGCVLAGPVTLSPTAAVGTNVSNAYAGATLSAFSGAPFIVFTLASPDVFVRASSWGNVWGVDNTFNSDENVWFSGDHQFRIDFAAATNFASISVFSNDPSDPVRVEIYDSGNTLLDFIESAGTSGAGVIDVLSFNRGSADIAYMTAGNPAGMSVETFLINQVVFDNPAIPLPGGAAMAMVGMGVVGVRRRRS